jgi:hypothetical protein
MKRIMETIRQPDSSLRVLFEVALLFALAYLFHVAGANQ